MEPCLVVTPASSPHHDLYYVHSQFVPYLIVLAVENYILTILKKPPCSVVTPSSSLYHNFSLSPLCLSHVLSHKRALHGPKISPHFESSKISYSCYSIIQSVPRFVFCSLSLCPTVHSLNSFVSTELQYYSIQ